MEQVPIGECPYPHEWTDEERERLHQEMDPLDGLAVAMRKVHQWRQEAGGAAPTPG